MRKIHMALILAAILPAQAIFANAQDMMSQSKPCAVIAAACLKAGFVRKEAGHKRIWQDCMKPVILGHTVKGITIDPAVVKECRTNKINKLKKELVEFQKAS